MKRITYWPQAFLGQYCIILHVKFYEQFAVKKIPCAGLSVGSQEEGHLVLAGFSCSKTFYQE